MYNMTVLNITELFTSRVNIVNFRLCVSYHNKKKKKNWRKKGDKNSTQKLASTREWTGHRARGTKEKIASPGLRGQAAGGE